MAADREFALPGAGARVRDFARRRGITGFWHWWTKELAALVPESTRAAVQRRRMRPVVAFDGDTATLWQPGVDDGQFSMRILGSISVAGDAETVASQGRVLLAKLATRGNGAASAPPRVTVALGSRGVLRKSIVVPAAIEENLRQSLGYDLDRHTPFKADELYFDTQVVTRDPVRNQIGVELVAALRGQVDSALRHVEAWGASVASVVPESPTTAALSRFNLLPPERSRGKAWWRRWQFWLPIAILATVALVAVVLPVWQKREYVIALNDLAGQAFQQAAAADALRSELDRQVGDYNFALERKYAYPGAVQILEDVTRLLPDDTWLTQLEIKTAGRGKDTQREVLFRGESANAGRLVTLLEDSRLFTQAAPRSPTTKIQPGPGEIFDLGAQLKPVSQPVPTPLVAPPAPAPGGTPGPATSAAQSATGTIPPSAPPAAVAPANPAAIPDAAKAPGAQKAVP